MIEDRPVHARSRVPRDNGNSDIIARALCSPATSTTGKEGHVC